MRIPHTVPSHALEAFRCSEETLLLPNELFRTLRSEEQDERGRPASLRTLALRAIAANWRRRPLPPDELPTREDRDHLLEILEELPFELAVRRLPEAEHYWQRASETRWRLNDPPGRSASWLSLYCERHLAEYLERAQPARWQQEERAACELLLRLAGNHVRVLRLGQLLPARASDGEVHHLPLDFVLERLPLLRELELNVGMVFASDGVEWLDFEFSIEDSLGLARGLGGLAYLSRFALTRSSLDRPRTAATLQGLARSGSIREVDLSHCKLADGGAHAVGAFLRRHCPPSLRMLRLVDNGIGADGLAGIALGLCDDNSDARLEGLDLRLNPLGDAGAVHLAAVLLRYERLRHLNVSACGLGGDGGMSVAEVLASGRAGRLELDCSNNELGATVGEAFEIVAKSCAAITELDCRMCGFRKQSEFSISESVCRNRARLKSRSMSRSNLGDEMNPERGPNNSLQQPPAEFARMHQRPHLQEAPATSDGDGAVEREANAKL